MISGSRRGLVQCGKGKGCLKPRLSAASALPHSGVRELAFAELHEDGPLNHSLGAVTQCKVEPYLRGRYRSLRRTERWPSYLPNE